MDKVSFQAKTVLITSPEKYNRRLQKHINIRSTMVSCMCNHIKGLTRKCKIDEGDIFVLVHNGKDGAIRRIAYNIQLGAKSLIDDVCKDLESFSKNIEENVSCIIMGGRPNDSVMTRCVNNIATSVESHIAAINKKMDLSIICGPTKELKPLIFVDFSRSLETPRIYLSAEIESPVSTKKLEEAFNIVELSNIELVD